MNKIYILSVNGERIYFYGELVEENYDKIQHICKQITVESTEKNVDKICNLFFYKVLSELNLVLIKLPIKHIFRIE